MLSLAADKTALAALVLATRHRPSPVLLGAVSALTIQSVVAVGAGHLVSLLPQRPVHVLAGVLFLVSALLMWRRSESENHVKDKECQVGFWRSAWIVFVVVFIAEWGDLTQLATAALAARYHSLFVVFAGATLALWTVAGLAIFVGNRAGRLLDPHLTKRVAAFVFLLLGAALLVGLL